MEVKYMFFEKEFGTVAVNWKNMLYNHKPK